MTLAVSLAIFAASFVSACARPGTESSPSPVAKAATNEPWVVKAELAAAPQLVARAKLSCAEPSECPENVALMFAVIEKSGDKITYHQCTSFLVSPDVIATNSHCVPASLRSTGSKCDGRIAFVFAEKKGVVARAECAEVLSASAIDEDPASRDYLRKTDVAFLKLTKPVVDRTPLVLDRSGLPDGTSLRALTIDPVKKGQLEGSLKIQNCSTVQATFANPSYVSELAGVATASGCDVRTGNSGAPMLDDAGRVRALVFGVLPTNLPMDVRGYQTPTSFQPIAYLTNSACVDTPPGVDVIGARASESECSTRAAKESLRERARKIAPIDFDDVASTWIQGAPKVFGYKVSDVKITAANNSFAKVSLPVLDCIVDPSRWPSPKLVRDGFDDFDRDGTVVTASLSVPVWGASYALDELYRVSIYPKTVDRAVIRVKFDSKEVSTGFAKVDVQVSSDKMSVKRKSMTMTIKACKSAD